MLASSCCILLAAMLYDSSKHVDATQCKSEEPKLSVDLVIAKDVKTQQKVEASLSAGSYPGYVLSSRGDGLCMVCLEDSEDILIGAYFGLSLRGLKRKTLRATREQHAGPASFPIDGALVTATLAHAHRSQCVWDPCCGSGTFLRACALSSRLSSMLQRQPTPMPLLIGSDANQTALPLSTATDGTRDTPTEWIVMDATSQSTHSSFRGKFADSILCDPPYDVRTRCRGNPNKP